MCFSFRLYASNDSILDDSDTQVGSGLSGASGSNLKFNSLSQTVASNDTAYFFITANVSPNLTAAGKTVGARIDSIGDLTFGGSAAENPSSSYDASSDHIIVSPSVEFTLDTATISEGSNGGNTVYNVQYQTFGNISSGTK